MAVSPTLGSGTRRAVELIGREHITRPIRPLAGRQAAGAFAKRRAERYTRRPGGSSPMAQIGSVLALLVAALAALSGRPRARAGAGHADHDLPARGSDHDGPGPEHAGPHRQLLLQPLRHAHPLGHRAQARAGLATSWKSVNDTTWEFALRPGVKFHDGAPLTAEDVKATIERNTIPGPDDRAVGLRDDRGRGGGQPRHDPRDHQEARSARARAHGPDGLADPARALHDGGGRQGPGEEAHRQRRLSLRRVGEGRAAGHGGQSRLVGLGGQGARRSTG